MFVAVILMLSVAIEPTQRHLYRYLNPQCLMIFLQIISDMRMKNKQHENYSALELTTLE